MDKRYSSDEIADSLILIAAKIRNGKPFETYYQPNFFLSFSDLRFDFVEAVRSIGGGEKKVTDFSFEMEKEIAPIFIHLSVAREAMCKKVKVTKEVEEWQCEPILATESA